MADTFVDTSGWGNIIDRSQPYHDLAVTYYRNLRAVNSRLVTTNYIISELTALLHRPLRLPRKRIVEFIQSLRTSPYVDIIHIDQVTDLHAWELFSDRLDKEWSLVDCASFVVMEERKILEALTTDKHFEQAGLVRLLQ